MNVVSTPAERVGREVGGFNEQWLQQLTWQLLRVDGEVAYYRVRSPNALRSWLIVRPAGSATENVFRRLQHEYHLRDALDPAWAVVPTALLYSAEGPLLVLDEPGGRRLDETQGSELSITLFLQLALGAALAVASLHEQGLLHRDLKPCQFIEGEDGVVRLAGFALASRPGPGVDGPPVISGSLAYMSPEQAGRLGGLADSRSDLYSLGVSFYEMLTGGLPFIGGDAVEWLHQHLAQAPLAPQRLRPDLPPVLAAMILRLLAKDPAQRYPSAVSLAQDLRRALVQWRETAEIQAPPAPSSSPLPGAWVPLLVGRSEPLLRLHQRVSLLREEGQAGTLLLGGQYGTGKTLLLRQLHQDLADRPLRFAACRFDPARQSIPYAAVCAAVRGLVLQVLGERPAVLQRWRQRLLAALGARAHLMLALVPEIDWVFGSLLPACEAASTEPTAPLDVLLADCLAVFARPARPLVLVFDDLQWLDRQSLEFLTRLIRQPMPHVLLIGAYRDAPGGHEPAFSQLLGQARQHAVETLKLAPLDVDAVHALLVHQLQWQAPPLHGLAAALTEKSAGNPFFVQQLLCNLIEDGLLRYVPGDLQGAARWEWDSVRLGRYPVTANVLELLLARLSRLPGSTRMLLGLLAVIGSRANALWVTRVSGYALDALQHDLAPAVSAGLLWAECEGWRFSHERVREAAYRLVPAERRSQEHTRIARLLINEMNPLRPAPAAVMPLAAVRPGPLKDPRALLFRIALHIQQAARDEVLEADRTAFIGVLLQAAQRARDTAALPFALEYLSLARELGNERRWREHYPQCHAVEQLYIQCLIHGGEHQAAHASIARLLERVGTLQERSMLHVLLVHSCSLAGDYQGAVQAGLAGLALFDIDFNGLAGQADAACARVQAELGDRSIAALIDLPANRDSRVEAALELLASLIVPAAFCRPGLALPVVSCMVQMTLQHGLSPASPRGLAWFGVALAQHTGDYQQGLRFADLANRLVARLPVPVQEASVLLALGQVSVWIRPLAFSIECDERAVACGRSEGAPVTSCYASHQWGCLLLSQGTPLDKVQARAEAGLALAGVPGSSDGHLLLQTQQLFIRRLRGAPGASLADLQALENRVLQGSMVPAQFWWWLFDAIQAFFDGKPAHALRSLDLAQALAWSLPAHIHHLDLVFYRALSLAALHSADGPALDTVTAIAPLLDKLRRWADLNRASFLDKCLLVEAEVARLDNQPLRALGLYEAAIAHAGSSESTAMQALGHELAARCYERLGLVSAARSHWRSARDHYQRWGALAKVRALEALHQCLHDPRGDARSSMDLPQAQHALDLISVTKASQALSREVVFDRLIETLIANTLVHAGAQRVALVLLDKGEPRVVARGHTGEAGVQVDLTRVSLDQAQLPTAVVYRVLRSAQWIAVNDAEQEGAQGEALLPVAWAGSMLCLPLLKQGEVTGVIYLDNPLSRGLFTEARIAVIELLAAQAAISLDTSRLYAQLLEQNQRRRDTELQLRNARAELAQVNQTTLMGELAASIAHEINQPLVSIVSNASASVRWLNRDQPEVGEALEGLRDIVSDGRRAAQIVLALQALAKQRTPNRSRLNLDEVIRQVLRLTTAEIEHRHVTVSTRLNTAGSRVFADGVLMQQVIYNLVINALDAMASLDEGHRHLTLVSSVETGGQVVVSVEDSGAGIDAAHIDKVFDAFFTTKPNGMGMGLAICRSIMIAQGGTLHALRGRGGETLFMFSLPSVAAQRV